MQAQLFDGKTAQPQEVALFFSADWLLIEAPDGRVLQWPRDQLRCIVSSAVADAERLAIAPDASSDTRLVIHDRMHVQEFYAQVPELHPTSRGNRRKKASFALAIALGILVSGLLLFLLTGRGVQWLAQLIPDSWEDHFGQRILTSLDENQSFCSGDGNVPLQELVNRLWAVDTHPPKVMVLDMEVENAFAAPGRWIVVFSGLIKEANKSDELAGVLAHEIGHIKYRHPLQSYLRLQELDLMAFFVGGGNISQWSAFLLQNAYSREMEAEADEEAQLLLQKAHIRSAGLADLFERLARKPDPLDKLPSLFSTHPDLLDRALKARALQKDGSPALKEDEWQKIKRICD